MTVRPTLGRGGPAFRGEGPFHRRAQGPCQGQKHRGAGSSGEILFFLDSDVCVHVDTLERVRRDFQDDPSLDALLGSYDSTPASPDFLSSTRT